MTRWHAAITPEDLKYISNWTPEEFGGGCVCCLLTRAHVRVCLSLPVRFVPRHTLRHARGLQFVSCQLLCLA